MEAYKSSETKTKKVPQGLQWLGLERLVSGIVAGWIAVGASFISSSVIGGGFQLSSFARTLIAAAGLLVFISGFGVLKRKAWARALVMIEAAVAAAGGIIAVTIIALSWPDAWGRGKILLFFVVILSFYLSIIALFVSLIRSAELFRRGEMLGRFHEGAGMLMKRAVIGLVIVRLVAWYGLGIEARQGQPPKGTSAPSQEETTQAEALQYCGTLAGYDQATCYVQVAAAAATSGDGLPSDYCARVAADEPQLKLLCIAFARQPESCAAFETVRERSLCQGLVKGDTAACDTIDDVNEQAQCVRTIEGYLDALQEEIEAMQGQ